MQPISSYSVLNNKLRLVLQGPSGTGKTTLACQFPGAYILDIDVKLQGSLDYIKYQNAHGSNLTLPLGFDRLDNDENGNIIDRYLRFQRLDKLLIEAQKDPSIQTIVLDSGTTLTDVIIDEVNRQQNKKSISDWKDGRQFWGLFGPFVRNFFSVLAAMRKHIVLICHERTQKAVDDKGNQYVVYPIKVAWPGQTGENIGAFFTNVWRTEVDKFPDGPGKTKYKWQIRTMPDAKYELLNSLMLPPTFEFKWETIEKALKGENK